MADPQVELKKNGPNGGPRPGAGRKRGSPNKVTGTLRDAAREYTLEALRALAEIMAQSDSDAARVSAANAILDRGYGKPSQVIGGDQDNPIQSVMKILLEGVPAK